MAVHNSNGNASLRNMMSLLLDTLHKSSRSWPYGRDLRPNEVQLQKWYTQVAQNSCIHYPAILSSLLKSTLADSKLPEGLHPQKTHLRPHSRYGKPRIHNKGLPSHLATHGLLELAQAFENGSDAFGGSVSD